MLPTLRHSFVIVYTVIFCCIFKILKLKKSKQLRSHSHSPLGLSWVIKNKLHISYQSQANTINHVDPSRRWNVQYRGRTEHGTGVSPFYYRWLERRAANSLFSRSNTHWFGTKGGQIWAGTIDFVARTSRTGTPSSRGFLSFFESRTPR